MRWYPALPGSLKKEPNSGLVYSDYGGVSCVISLSPLPSSIAPHSKLISSVSLAFFPDFDLLKLPGTRKPTGCASSATKPLKMYTQYQLPIKDSLSGSVGCETAI